MASSTSGTVLESAGSLSGAAIITRDLTKRYQSRADPAVSELDMVVPRGSVYGFLGPNGSGKTTTIRMLLGLVSPSAGTVELLDEPIPQGINRVLPRVGTLIEGPAFHSFLSGHDNLARLDAVDATAERRTAKARIGRALDRVGLGAAAGKTFRHYSLGMKQRLGIAAALLRERELLILDEPTNGLDPQGTREVRTLIAELAAEGTTVLLSTHLLPEVEQVCSHVGIVRAGVLQAQGSLSSLRPEPHLRVVTAHTAETMRVLAELGLVEVVATESAVTAQLPSPAPEPEKILRTLMTENVAVREFRFEQSSLEDLFIKFTGEGFDVSA